MEEDPFDWWYSAQIDENEEANYKAGEWRFITLTHDAHSQHPVVSKEITASDVDAWVDEHANNPAQVPGVSLLIAQHKKQNLKNMDKLNYHWLPFRADHFKSIFRRLHLPMQYFHLRTKGGAHAGGAAYRTHRDASGRVERMSFVIRAASSFVNRFSAPCALAMAWHASSRRTIGFIDGISSSDISVLSRTLGTLTHASNSLAHPLTVPEIFLHCIVVNLNERVRIPAEESFYDEEIRTGLNIVVLAPGALEHGIWNWRYEDFQTSTARANKYATTVAYLKRRFNFALGVTKRLLEVLEEMEGYDYVEEGVKEMLSVQSWSRRERLLNRKMALEGHEHQCDCMQLRVNNLISVLYTIPTQLSARQSSHLSRINLRIAHAVRTDSIPVRTIAYVTLVFLPGAFVSSIFGMNFFDYEAETSRLRVSASFWQYWAITVPVTLCVLLLWNVWVWREKRKGSEGAGGGEGLAWEGDVAEEVAMAGKI